MKESLYHSSFFRIYKMQNWYTNDPARQLKEYHSQAKAKIIFIAIVLPVMSKICDKLKKI
ncbi:hypothetical protein LS73_002490 [Helicobacter muridarum]|uniref:Uncharacterized protein n=1 Tax=Helicobacter muridarum TaxID=216 RepID=A0A377PUF3_9HELI|nr:hypothetical protein [Helicobacter muridarum]TLE01160.1 hypothetical protein LS73_002490 [Helicobacter muridarum]STQ86032.1 Uncharacterised protein [Helicobacter muridarum]